MDSVDYTDAGVRRMKGIRHFSDWKLIIPLLLLTSYTACDISTPSSVPELADSNKQSENLTTCTGETASFTWAYEIQPFFVVEWYFENIPIAQTSKESFVQDDISITPKYTDRFHLQTTGKVGFTLTNVTNADTGNYRCIVTLKSTDIPKELNKELQVKGGCFETSTISSNSDEKTTPTNTTHTDGVDTRAIVLGVLIPCGVIAVIGTSVWLRRRCNRSNRAPTVSIVGETELMAPSAS